MRPCCIRGGGMVVVCDSVVVHCFVVVRTWKFCRKLWLKCVAGAGSRAGSHAPPRRDRARQCPPVIRQSAQTPLNHHNPLLVHCCRHDCLHFWVYNSKSLHHPKCRPTFAASLAVGRSRARAVRARRGPPQRQQPLKRLAEQAE